MPSNLARIDLSEREIPWSLRDEALGTRGQPSPPLCAICINSFNRSELQWCSRWHAEELRFHAAKWNQRTIPRQLTFSR